MSEKFTMHEKHMADTMVSPPTQPVRCPPPHASLFGLPVVRLAAGLRRGQASLPGARQCRSGTAHRWREPALRSSVTLLGKFRDTS